jgi:hypothetical protein
MTEEIHWLQTVSHEQKTESRYSGMYVRLTGSGSNIAVLTKDPPKFLRCHSDDAGHEFFTSWKHPGRLWSFVLVDQEEIREKGRIPTNTNLPMWSPVEIREEVADGKACGGDKGFSFSKEDHAASPALDNTASNGWMVCEWAYGHPQLFYLTAAYDETKALPSFCERVSLVKVQVQNQEQNAGE